MATEEKIMTLHPQAKAGVNILKRRYDFIIKTVEEYEEISYERLNDLAVEELTESFDGKVGWYIVTVKLDLEARKVIERVPKTIPHKIRLGTAVAV